MRAILPLVATLVGLAACESPTAPTQLNPQPLPPGLHAATGALNPQPLPPGLRLSVTTGSTRGQASGVTTSTCLAVKTYEPPDPCLR